MHIGKLGKSDVINEMKSKILIVSDQVILQNDYKYALIRDIDVKCIKIKQSI